MWVRGKRKAHIALTDAGEDISLYPFVLVLLKLPDTPVTKATAFKCPLCDV